MSRDLRGHIKGRSPLLLDALARIERVAATTMPVLILGETGTGKELAARLVHDLSRRAQNPFKVVNCAAIPEDLLESTLFGHVRGAFTGASDRRSGMFQAANGGTVFLDEIGEMSPRLQAKVLRVLEEGTVLPLGTEHVKQVDVRIVVATHRDLRKMVTDGDFRRDLYYRIHAYRVRLPALKDRGRDIVLLARYFLRRLYPSKRLARDAERLLLSQAWPGNVRELHNVIEAAGVDAGRKVEAQHVRYHLDTVLDIKVKETNGSRTDRILSIVDRIGCASPAELLHEMALPRTTLRRTLNDMAAADLIRRVGKGRRTRYVRSSPKGVEQLTARQKFIMRYVRDTGRITRLECAEMTSTSVRTASRDLAELVRLGRLVPDGRSGNAAGYALA